MQVMNWLSAYVIFPEFSTYVYMIPDAYRQYPDISNRFVTRNAIGADLLSGWLRTAFIYTGMTDYPTPSNFLNPMPAYPVKQV